jgi:O-antigen ligase
MEESLFRHYLGYRSFATFNAPQDFGYYMTLTLLLALFLDNLPHRAFVGVVALLGLTLAGTRTFLFSLPPLLVAYSLMTGPWIQRIKRTTAAVALIALFAVIYVNEIPSVAAENRSTLESLLAGSSEDESLQGRLDNLNLVLVTYNTAPMMGIVSRDMLPNAVDSEYVMTFHRYGFVGVAETLLLYVICLAAIVRRWRLAPSMARFCLFLLIVTFLYGITQGALINTRTGCYLFLLLGVFIVETSSLGLEPAGDPHP